MAADYLRWVFFKSPSILRRSPVGFSLPFSVLVVRLFISFGCFYSTSHFALNGGLSVVFEALTTSRWRCDVDEFRKFAQLGRMLNRLLARTTPVHDTKGFQSKSVNHVARYLAVSTTEPIGAQMTWVVVTSVLPRGMTDASMGKLIARGEVGLWQGMSKTIPWLMAAFGHSVTPLSISSRRLPQASRRGRASRKGESSIEKRTLEVFRCLAR